MPSGLQRNYTTTQLSIAEPTDLRMGTVTYDVVDIMAAGKVSCRAVASIALIVVEAGLAFCNDCADVEHDEGCECGRDDGLEVHGGAQR